MRKFEWQSLLEPGESIVWRDDKSKGRLVWALLIAAVVVAAILYFLLSQVVADATCQARATAYCAPLDRKLPFALFIGPVLIFFLLLSAFMTLFVQNHYAVTNLRIIDFHDAVWRKAPRVKSLPLGQVHAILGPRTVIMRNATSFDPATALEWGATSSQRSNRDLVAAIKNAKAALASNPPRSSIRNEG